MFSSLAGSVFSTRPAEFCVRRTRRRAYRVRVLLYGCHIHGRGNSLVTRVLLSTIRGYKRYVSPGLRPACRFVPTCSEYALEALEQYGTGRGLLLASWRVLRCSPFGGSGYDPPRWPPVRYRYVGLVPPRAGTEVDNPTKDSSE
jgi:putative membrane protein insertion efficiency factor